MQGAMGLRFRRSWSVIPGVRFNFGSEERQRVVRDARSTLHGRHKRQSGDGGVSWNGPVLDKKISCCPEEDLTPIQ